MIKLALFAVLAVTALVFFIALLLRRVVPTNEVHIVQSSKATTSYGKDSGNGNTYYEWPEWFPLIGVTKVVMPVSVFDVTLQNYPAYDQGRVPFVLDLVGFFRIENSNLAAQRVSSFGELHSQLQSILQGSVRALLASSTIEEIMQERSKFGDGFTNEVEKQLAEWGVAPVKNLELMDIRDANGSTVIANIMEKKKSLIEMQSRVEVATNRKNAEIAEVEATRETDMKKTEAEQTVQLRITEKNKSVGLAQETAKQEVHTQAKVTKEKEMAVVRVHDLQREEINRDMAVVKAEAQAKATVLDAEAAFESDKLKAQAVTLEGKAKAEAEKAMQLAPVEAQIVLAKEIGGNQGYQTYLVTIEGIKAQQAVGIEQAKALNKADIKVIANTGTTVADGLTSFGELFSAQGGLKVGAALETLANTDAGKDLINKFAKKSS